MALHQKAVLKRYFKALNKKLIQEEQKVSQIQATDKQIDQMVYELYELTPYEIQIVENA